MSRVSSIQRKTNETHISCQLNLDGKGKYQIKTGIGFFDHMLEQFSRHSFIDVSLQCDGDLHIDAHHTMEDVGITLGQALNEALGEKKGIKRYGQFYLPMDETLLLVAIDLSGRPYLVFDVPFTVEMIGGMPTEMVEEFFRALSQHANMTLHIKMIHGKNNHHIAEAVFKGFAKAFEQAVQYDSRVEGVASTKGIL